MRVAELMELLSHVDPKAEVILSAESFEENLCIEQIQFIDGSVVFDLYDFVDSMKDYYEVLAAL